jgi:site-specific DNA-methyltransferase (adenine-specific)
MEIAIDNIYNLDCVRGMELMDQDSVDLVITDPPFAIDFKPGRANYNRRHDRVLRGYNEIPADEYYAFTLSWMRQVARLLRRSGSMFVFSGWNNLKDILVALDETGFVTVNHIIWKYQFGVVTRRRFVSSHYHCLYVCRDDRGRKFFPFSRYDKHARDSAGRSLHYRDKEDVWVIKREYWNGDKKTPTKLPRELIEKMLCYCSEPGDIVLDPFLGSGQVAVVSRMLGRRYVGFEISSEYYDFARERLTSNSYRLPAGSGSSRASLK